MKLTKEEYFSLWSDDISKKQYDIIISKINDRFYYIMKTICIELNWWDFDNGWEEGSGFFEPCDYYKNSNTYITFRGNYRLPQPYSSCPNIPIRWLWEDFEESFKKEVEEYKIKKEQDKIKAKEKRELAKINKENMRGIISSKLTKEELKYIKFK